MRLSTLITAALLPLAAVASQVPIIEKDKLSKVIDKSRYLSLHRSLCEIASTTNEEHGVGKWLKELLEKHHFEVITQEVPARKSLSSSGKSRLNLYAYPDPKHYKDTGVMKKGKKKHKKGKKHHKKPSHPPSPKVLLTSHIDTVPPHIPYSLVYNSTSSTFNSSDILILGRGTVDDKACVAAQITVAMDFLVNPPKDVDFEPSELAMLFVVDEESGGRGMIHFSESELYHTTNENYKAILFGEPTERKLVSAHKGIFMVTIDAKGKAAHSGYPWLGHSANSMILPALTVLDGLGGLSEHMGGFPTSDVLGNTTVNVGLIQGGVASNVIPEYAHAEVSFRLAAGTVEANKLVVDSAIASVDTDGLLSVEYTQGYGPVLLDFDVPGFESIAVNYGTDVPNLEVAPDVKRYLYGPGSIFVAHGKNEGLSVGEMEAGLEGYGRLLAHALRL